MLKFLKKKLGNWVKNIKKTEEAVEEKPEKIVEKPEKPLEPLPEKLKEQSKELEKAGFFKRIKKKLKASKTIKLNEKKAEKMFSELELILLENNVALEVVDKIKKELKEKIIDKEFEKQNFDEQVKKAIRETFENILIEPFDLVEKIKKKKEKTEKIPRPFVIVFFGINGGGKTTTIAKICQLLKKNKLSSVLGAADTFRAASIEQLEQHSKKLGVKTIKHDYGADPAAVGFDAIKYAKAHKIDVVLIDTAGRMHTKTNLLKEMGKICRVTKPDLKIFVGESITGNDATNQAKNFNSEAGIDAIILTKAEIDEKGGTAISVGFVTKKPIILLGTGQNYEDLEKFNKQKLLEALGL